MVLLSLGFGRMWQFKRFMNDGFIKGNSFGDTWSSNVQEEGIVVCNGCRLLEAVDILNLCSGLISMSVME